MNLPPVPGGPADPPAPPPPTPVSSVPPAPATAADPYHGDIRHWDAATRAPFMQHRLAPFETAGVVVLGILTLNIFAVIYHGLKHSRLPRVRPDDFSAGKAIGFLFIPFYNFYWVFVFWTRLAQRINFQFKLRNLPPPVAEELGQAIAVLTMLSFIPVLGVVTAVVNWLIIIPIFSAQIQSAANRLAAGATIPGAGPESRTTDTLPVPSPSLAGPPAAQPPPLTSPPPPPPPPLPPAGPPLSRRTLLWIGGGVAALMAVIILIARLESPTDSAVRSFVKAELAREGFDINNVSVNRREKGAKTVTYNINITYRRSAESLYEALLPEITFPKDGATSSADLVTGGVSGGGVPGGVIAPRYAPNETQMPDWLPLDLALWRRVRTQLASPNGPRLRRTSGLTTEDEALLSATLVREIPKDAGSAPRISYVDGTVRAQRRGLLWDFTFERQNFSDPETGSRRRLESFRGKVLVLDRAEDRDALLDLARRLPGINDQLTRAVGVLLTEAKLRWLTLLKPQTLFAGTTEFSEHGRKHKASIYLEITETRPDEDPPRLSAMVRNDGGWQESRLFAGRIVYDDASGRFQLKLTAPAGENARGGGPFLDDNAPGFGLRTDEDGDRILPLLLEEGALVWKAGPATLRLEPVRDSATLIAGLQDGDLRLREATGPGKAYLGTITSRAKGTKETWLLRFNPHDEDAPEDGNTLSARLEHPDKRTWKCALRGSLLFNRYRAKDAPVRLYQDHDSALSPPKEITDLFDLRGGHADEYGPALGLRLDGDKLAGETPRFVFQFAPASPEQVAAIEKKWADDAEAERKQLLAATSPGTIYRGTVTTRSGSRREEFLLRFLEPEDAGNDPQSRTRRIRRGAGVPAPADEKRDDVLRARIEHPDHPSWRLPLTGRLQLDPEGADNLPVLLNTTGNTAYGKEARKNSFLDDNYEEIRLRPDGTGLTGESSDYRFLFNRLAPEAAAQLQQRDADARARLLAFIQPGAAHDGTLEVKEAKPGLLRLRFLKLENDGEKVEALLQSRLRPQFAWRMTGNCNLAEYRLELNNANAYGSSPSALNADPDLQPLMRSFSSRLHLYWDNDAVVGGYTDTASGVKFRFQPSTPEQLARQRAEEAEREARLLAFVQPGAVHDGTVEVPGFPAGLLRLRIVKMENRGERVEAVLQSRARPRYVLQMTGKCDLSAGTLRLQWNGAPTRPALLLSKEPDLSPHFHNFGVYNGSLVLSLEQNSVSGTHNNLTFGFVPSSPARLAELQKEEADRLARALAFVQPGTEHEGTVGRDGRGSGKVRLRILKMDDRGKRIEARLESAQSPQHAQKLTGWLALDGRLLLARIDSGPADANGRMLFADPALQTVYPNGFYSYNEFELAFTDTALEGYLEGNAGAKLILPLR